MPLERADVSEEAEVTGWKREWTLTPRLRFTRGVRVKGTVT